MDSTCLLYRATPECFQYSEALHGDYAASYRQAVQLLIKNDYETIMNRITKENNQLNKHMDTSNFGNQKGRSGIRH